ncbi:hypothetical protein Pgy4_25333, partial [Pseudomonas savastanoi pv. glycinea str. race 4]
RVTQNNHAWVVTVLLDIRTRIIRAAVVNDINPIDFWSDIRNHTQDVRYHLIRRDQDSDLASPLDIDGRGHVWLDLVLLADCHI